MSYEQTTIRVLASKILELERELKKGRRERQEALDRKRSLSVRYGTLHTAYNKLFSGVLLVLADEPGILRRIGICPECTHQLDSTHHLSTCLSTGEDNASEVNQESSGH